MLELRQRSRSSGSVSGNYQAVDTDDELDSIPLLGLRGVKAVPKAHSTVCEFFSVKNVFRLFYFSMTNSMILHLQA